MNLDYICFVNSIKNQVNELYKYKKSLTKNDKDSQ